jgi:hypothetical protein
MWIFLIVFIIGIITREGDLSSSPAVCYHLLTDPRNSRRNSAPGRQQWIGPQNANYHLPMWKMSFGTFQGTWIESFSSCGLDLRWTRGLGLGSRRKKKTVYGGHLGNERARGSYLFATLLHHQVIFFFNQLIVLISPVGRQRCRSSSTFVALPFFVEEKI